MDTILSERINSLDPSIKSESETDDGDSSSYRQGDLILTSTDESKKLLNPESVDRNEVILNSDLSGKSDLDTSTGNDECFSSPNSTENGLKHDISSEQRGNSNYIASSPKRLCASLDSSPADTDNKISINDSSPLMSKSSHSSPSQTKRRSRTVMTPSQTRILHAVLEETYFPSNEQREQLSKILQIPQRTIQVWFQNQRQKAKQFGKPPEPSSTPSTSSSPSISSLRQSPGNGFHPGISISSYSHIIPNQSFPGSNYHHPPARRPILLYGTPSQSTTGIPNPVLENLYLPIEHVSRFPINSEIPIRKRTLPIQSSTGSWEYPGSKLNHSVNCSVDHCNPSLPSWIPAADKYKGYRSGSLPIQALYSTSDVGYFNQSYTARPNNRYETPDSSPSNVLSSLLQSTSLLKKDDENTKNSSTTDVQKINTSSDQEQIKDIEKFKDEEDQLELPSLLLALRG